MGPGRLAGAEGGCGVVARVMAAEQETSRLYRSEPEQARQPFGVPLTTVTGRVSGYQAVFMPVSGSIPAVPGSWIVKVMTAPVVTSIPAIFSVGMSPGLSE